MVTGGAGFIGSAVIRQLIADGYATIINVDILTYAGNESTVSKESGYLGYRHERVDIRHAQRKQIIHAVVLRPVSAEIAQINSAIS